MEDQYQFQPLNQEAREIRLIKILYADEDAQHPSYRPSCLLKHVDLDSAPEFQALSYTWGPPTDTATIYVEGKLYTIRRNLWEFFRQKAQDKNFCEDVWIWIDQICINQDHLLERNHQVGQMSLVYSQAKRVVIWLGSGTGETDRAMSCLAAGVSVWNADLDTVHGATRDSESCLEVIAGLDYFTRLWIIQEVVLARKVVMLCGAKQLQWHDLMLHIRWREGKFEVEHRKAKSPISGSRLSALVELRGSSPVQRAGKSWREILELTREAQCQDPRDRIYGLLGLIDSSLGVAADYSSTAEDLFWAVLRIQLHNDAPKYSYDLGEVKWGFRQKNMSRLRERTPRADTNVLVSDLLHALQLSPSWAMGMKIVKTLASERSRIGAYVAFDRVKTVGCVIAAKVIPEDLHKMLRAEYRAWKQRLNP